MRISLVVPCFNEEKSLEATIESCLHQTRSFDQIIFVDDSSTDQSPRILARYSNQILIKRTPENTGNKSSALEYGIKYVTGSVFVTTDADTLLDPFFCEEIEKSFEDKSVFAAAGYVRSLPYNWLTLCRAYEYAIGQNIHKLAQSYMSYVFVMPGAASAFRTKAFKERITFDHDTITEDLDFTYKMHRDDLKIIFNRNAICYTQDPTNLRNYANQMRRWFGGGWQNLLKHHRIATTKPIRALELSLSYVEGVTFSMLIFVLPLLNPLLWLYSLLFYVLVAQLFAFYAACIEKRWAIALVPLPYLIIVYVNAFVYLEQLTKEVFLRRKNLTWFKPERIVIETNT